MRHRGVAGCGCAALWLAGLLALLHSTDHLAGVPPAAALWGQPAAPLAAELPDCPGPAGDAVLGVVRRLLPHAASWPDGPQAVRRLAEGLRLLCSGAPARQPPREHAAPLAPLAPREPETAPGAAPSPAPPPPPAGAPAGAGGGGEAAGAGAGEQAAISQGAAGCGLGPLRECDGGETERRCAAAHACDVLLGGVGQRYKPASVQPAYPNRGRGGPGWRAEWLRLHKTLKADAERNGRAARLVFVGDSLTAALRPGTATSSDPTAPYGSDATHPTWLRHFGGARPVALGIGGDETQHLLWRLLNGELGAAGSADVAVLLVGTNNFNLHKHESRAAADASRGIGGIAWLLCRYLLARRSRLLVLGVLPRGGPCTIAPKWKRCRLPWHSKIEEVNRRVARLLPGLCPGGNETAAARFADCGWALLNTSAPGGEGQMSPALQPDMLHLSTAGYEALWTRCLLREIRELGPSVPLGPPQ